MTLQDRAAADQDGEPDSEQPTGRGAGQDGERGAAEAAGGTGPAAPPARPTAVTVLRGTAVGAAVGAALAAARAMHLLHGWAALALLALLALALPTSRSLSRRILLTGCLAFGWVPLLWWRPLPLGETGRGGLLLGLTGGLLAGWVAGGPAPRQRLRRVLPALRPIDAFPLLAAAATAVRLSAWLRVSSGVKALALLLGGWDNSAHSDMVAMIRAHGATVDALGAGPDGTTWSYANYPQGFHAIVATVVELLTRPAVGTPSAEIAGFVHGIAVVMVGLVAVLAAGICAAPQLRRCPALALPPVALVTAGFTLGPGGDCLRSGHTNFVLAAGLVAATALVAWSMARVVLPLHLAALGGALVGVAHNWALLLTVAAPAALVAVLPLRRRRWTACPAAWGACVAVLVATGFACLQAVRILSTIDTGSLLSLTGSSIEQPIGVVLAVALGAAAACLAAGRAGVRTVALAAVPAVGLLAMAGIAAQQLRTSPRLTYYFWKYASGVELAALVLLALAVAVAVALAGRGAPSRGVAPSGRNLPRGVARVAASLALACAATQVFGYTGPGVTAVGQDQLSPGLALGVQSGRSVAHPPAAASRLLAAAGVQAAHPDVVVVYLALPPRDLRDAANAEQWYRSLTRTWTSGHNRTGLEPARRLTGLTQGAEAATRILRYSSTELVVVGPELVAPLRARLAPELRARVVTW